MSSKELYKRFMALCQRWPKDESKVGRDYGEYFRFQIMAHFPHGELSHVDDTRKIDRDLSALERIANNIYYNENQLKRSSASGLESWACTEAISNEGIKMLQDQDEASIINRLKTSLSLRFSDSQSDRRFLDDVDIKEKDKLDKK